MIAAAWEVHDTCSTCVVELTIAGGGLCRLHGGLLQPGGAPDVPATQPCRVTTPCLQGTDVTFPGGSPVPSFKRRRGDPVSSPVPGSRVGRGGLAGGTASAAWSPACTRALRHAPFRPGVATEYSDGKPAGRSPAPRFPAPIPVRPAPPGIIRARGCAGRSYSRLHRQERNRCGQGQRRRNWPLHCRQLRPTFRLSHRGS